MRALPLAKKALAVALSAGLVAWGPGGRGYLIWAQGDAGGREVIDPVTRRRYFIRNASVADVLRTLQDPNLRARMDPEMRGRLEDYLRRLDPHAGDSPEVAGALRQLQEELSRSNEDPGLVLTRFFSNTASAASRLEEGRIHSSTLVDGRWQRRIITTNANIGVQTQDIRIDTDPHDRDFKRFTVRQPDARDHSRQVIEQIGYIAYEKGREVQKIAYSRSFANMVRMVIRMFYTRYDMQDLLEEPTVSEDGKRKLREDLEKIRREFPAEILDFEREMTVLERRIAQSPEIPPAELKVLAERLKAIQSRVLAYYNTNQVETLQKTLLSQFIYYFTAVSNVSFNPFERKDGTGMDVSRMDIAEVQKALDGFESGSIPGVGIVPWMAGLSTMDYKTHLSQELQIIAAEAIRYLSFAAQAQAKLFKPGRIREGMFKEGLSDQEKQAILSEMDKWVRLAQTQIQRFEIHTLAVQVWRLKENKLTGDMGIRSDARMVAEVERMLRVAEREIMPELARLDRESKAAMVREVGFALHSTLQKTRYSTLSAEAAVEELAEMEAQAKQLKALFLAQQFTRYTASPAFRARFSGTQEVQGKIYEHFLANLGPEIKRVLAGFDGLVASIATLKGRPLAQIKDGLGPVQADLTRLIALLGMPDVVNAEVLKRQDEKLKVFQANLGQVVANFSNNLRLLDMINELDIYFTKYASSEKTDSDKWYEFRFIDRFINTITGGYRDQAGHKAAEMWNPKAWEVLKKNEPIRKEVLELLRQGRYDEAIKRIAAIDPEAAKKARERYERDKGDFEADFDIISMLSRGLQSADFAAANAAVAGAFNHLQSYMKAFMAGTAAVDFVAMSLLTAGFGSLLATALNAAGRLALAASRAMSLARAARTMQQLSRIHRVMRLIMHTTGKVLVHMGRNVRVTLALPKGAREGIKTLGAGQRILQTVGGAFRFQTRMTVVMALASGMMSVGMHGWEEWRHPGSSQFKGVGDAAVQGALGGASFGAKTGFLFLLSPVPTTAFSKTGFGGVVRALGQSAGPIEGLVKFGARVTTTTTAPTALKALGPWNKLASLMPRKIIPPLPATLSGRQLIAWGALATGRGLQWIGTKGVSTVMGFVDGGLKFFIWAQAAKEIVQVASYGAMSLWDKAANWSAERNGGEAKEDRRGDFAAVGHINQLVEARAWGTAAEQVSWIFMPQQPNMPNRDIKQQREQMRALGVLESTGRLKELLRKDIALEGKLRVEKPFLHMGFGERIAWLWGKALSKISKGRAAPERPFYEIEVNEATRGEALDRLAKHLKRFSNAELLAMRSSGEGDLNMPHLLAQFVRETLSGKKGEAPGEGTAADAADMMIIEPIMMDKADMLLRERIGGDKKLLADLIAQGLQYEAAVKNGKPATMTLDGQVISNPKVINDLLNLTAWAAIERAPLRGEAAGRRGLWARLKAGFSESAPLKSNAEVIGDALVEGAQKGVKEFLAAKPDADPKEVAEAAMQATLKAMEELASQYKGPDAATHRWALERHRASLQGAALDRYNAESFVKDALSGRFTPKEGEPLSAAAERRIQQAGAIAELALRIQDVVDAHGVSIKEYKEVQLDMYREWMNILVREGPNARHSIKAYLLAHTGAGKSIIAMIMLMPMLQAIAKEGKLEGVDFNTHGDLLRAQAQAVYRALFKGRSPDFRIQTYDNIFGEHLTAMEQGDLSPLERRIQLCDEFDQVFLDPPTSLGVETGYTSKGNPVWKVIEGWTSKIDAMVAKYGRMTAEQFSQRLKTDAGFRAEFNALVEQGKLELPAAIKAARAQGGQFRREAKDFARAIGGRSEFDFGWEGFARVTLADFYKTSSRTDHTLYSLPDRGKGPGSKPLDLHGGHNVFDNLDTGGEGLYYQIKQGSRLRHPFENLEMTDAADFLSKARFLVGLSGTLPEMLRPHLGKNVHIVGHGTPAADSAVTVKASRAAAVEFVADRAYQNAAAAKGGKKHLSAVVVNTVGELAQVREILVARMMKERGLTRAEAEAKISRVQTGDTFYAEKRFLAKQIRQEQNLDALGTGEAEFLLLTAGVSRGLDLKLKKYAKVGMYGLGPENMSLVNFIQTQGRIHLDRLGVGVEREFIYATDVVTLRNNPSYRSVGERLVEIMLGGAQKELQLVAEVAAGARLQWKRKGGAPAGLEKMSDKQVADAYLEGVEAQARQLWKTQVDVQAKRWTKELAGQVKDGKITQQEMDAKLVEVNRIAAEAHLKISKLTRQEALQKALESPEFMEHDAARSAVRDLVTTRRLAEEFRLELGDIAAGRMSSKAFMDRLFTDAAMQERFLKLVLRDAQRQAEKEALDSSGITMIERRAQWERYENMQFLKVAGLSIGLGVVAALATGFVLPGGDAWQLIHDPLIMLASFLTMRMALLESVRKGPPLPGEGEPANAKAVPAAAPSAPAKPVAAPPPPNAPAGEAVPFAPVSFWQRPGR